MESRPEDAGFAWASAGGTMEAAAAAMNVRRENGFFMGFAPRKMDGLKLVQGRAGVKITFTRAAPGYGRKLISGSESYNDCDANSNDFTSSAFLLLPPAFAQVVPAAQPSNAAAAKPAFSMTDAQKADAAEHVRTETLHAWEGYKKYAWGHDSLKPLTKQPFDWYGPGHSLLMTPLDALDTLILMGLKPQADEARKLIDTELNLNQDIYVKDFEITIRLLGSLISCYEGTGDKRLLELADELGRRMLPMFDSPTGMPYEYVNLRTGAVRGTRSNPAEIGTLLLEFGMLSRLTGKPVYYDRAKRAVVELYKRQSAIGLVGSEIDVETGKWTNTTAGIMGGIDSYYEYLLKASILFGDKDCERCGGARRMRSTTILRTLSRTGFGMDRRI